MADVRLIDANAFLNELETIKSCLLGAPVSGKDRAKVIDMVIGTLSAAPTVQHECTCLWLKNLPPLERKNNFSPPEPVYVSNGEKHKKISWCEGIRGTQNGQEGRAKARSKTAPGIAKAMAEQWG